LKCVDALPRTYIGRFAKAPQQVPALLRSQIPESIKPLRQRVLQFMEQHVYPLEKILFEDRAEGLTRLREVQQEAKRQGLWALGHPKEVCQD